MRHLLLSILLALVATTLAVAQAATLQETIKEHFVVIPGGVSTPPDLTPVASISFVDALRAFADDMDAVAADGVVETVVSGVTIRWHRITLQGTDVPGTINIAASQVRHLRVRSGAARAALFAVGGNAGGGSTIAEAFGSKASAVAVGGHATEKEKGGDAFAESAAGSALAAGGNSLLPDKQAGMAEAFVNAGSGTSIAAAGMTPQFLGPVPNPARGAPAFANAVDGLATARGGPAGGFGSKFGERGGTGRAFVEGTLGTAIAAGGFGGFVMGPTAKRAGPGGFASTEADTPLGAPAVNCASFGGPGGGAAAPVLIGFVIVATRADGGKGGDAEARNEGGTANSNGGGGGSGRGAGRKGGDGGTVCRKGTAGAAVPGPAGPGESANLLDPSLDVAAPGNPGVEEPCD